jgi:hypothetical protein
LLYRAFALGQKSVQLNFHQVQAAKGALQTFEVC